MDNINNAEKTKYSVKIWYKDRNDILKEAIIPFEKEKSFESIKTQVDYIMSSILVDDGGFWLDKNTIIPAHRICEIQYFEDNGVNKIENPPTVNAVAENRKVEGAM